MENILAQMIRAAFLENAVARQALTNGRLLLVYPMGSAALIGVGKGAAESSAGWLEDLLRRRSGDMLRMGAWLPAMLADGSVYVLRRIAGIDSGGDAVPLSAEDLQAAEELLS